MEKTIIPSGLRGTIRMPASKSHTIRALLIASLAEGKSIIREPLFSDDSESCINACRLLGAQIDVQKDVIHVSGTSGKPAVPEDVIDVGNSGTTLYLAMSVAALGAGTTVFTGDDQIRRRSAGFLLAALQNLGATAVSTRDNGCTPLIIQGPLKGGKTSIECPTSQYLSSLLIATPLAKSDTEINITLLNEKPYVDIMLQWLDGQDMQYDRRDYTRFRVKGRQTYRAFDRTIPADFSSATFFLCAAAITGSEISLEGLNMDDAQGDKAVVAILQEMGCKVEVARRGAHGSDTAEDGRGILTIKGGELRGASVNMNAIPDALPALAVTACFAEGETRLENVPQARLKETDRISVMAEELRKMGGRVEELPDGLVIHGRGKGSSGTLTGARVNGHNDHRVAMSLAMAGLAAAGETVVETAESAAVTFPDFYEKLAELGAEIR
jgi:3-phosphoshikimate 1-carboxyvinyltransferase